MDGINWLSFLDGLLVGVALCGFAFTKGYKLGRRLQPSIRNTIAAFEHALHAAGYWEDRARLSEQKIDLVIKAALHTRDIAKFMQEAHAIKNHQPRHRHA